MSSTWTCAKHLTTSHETTLSVEWADMDLMGGHLDKEAAGWSQTGGQQLSVQVEGRDRQLSSGSVLGLALFKTSVSDMDSGAQWGRCQTKNHWKGLEQDDF